MLRGCPLTTATPPTLKHCLKSLLHQICCRPYSLFLISLCAVMTIFSLEVVIFDPHRGAGALLEESYGGQGGSATGKSPTTLSAITALNQELRSLLYNRVLTVEEFTASFLGNLTEKMRERCTAQLQAGKLASPGNNYSDTVLESASETSSDSLHRSQSSTSSTRRCWDGCDGRRQHLALIIPYRQRESHLKLLLGRLHSLLKKQKICYQIFVSEQSGNATFNKGKLMNAGFIEAMRIWNFKCVIFHDVDLLPLNANVPYWCPAQPRHISVGVDQWNYSLPYHTLVGGVLGMSIRHFLRVNGYSNMFWGWGAEDDDMAERIQATHLVITRPNPKLAQFKMLKHAKQHPSSWLKRFKLLYLSSKRYRLDGLNSLTYEVISRTELPKFTHLMIDVGPPPASVTL